MLMLQIHNAGLYWEQCVFFFFLMNISPTVGDET